MSVEVGALTVVVALAAALRSTWSPCGLSMLSSITPMAERSRGHRYWVTASWFVLGALCGGATLGLGAALLAAGVGAIGPSEGTVAALVAAGAAAVALVDAGAFLHRPPFFRRQVDDAWLSSYRSWVYGSGFGWQIGTGLATYIMTAAVFLTIGMAALTGSPATAFAIGVVFGGARGLVVLLGAGLRSPAALGALHARLDALEAPVRWGVVAVSVAVAVAAIVAAPGPGAALAVAVVLVAAAVTRLSVALRSPQTSPTT